MSLDAAGRSWQAELKGGDKLDFDAVCITVPAPQVLKDLGGNWRDHISASSRTALEGVSYSSRFVAVLTGAGGAPLPPPPAHAAEYVETDAYDGGSDGSAPRGALRFASADAAKRTGKAEAGAVLLHASVPFSLPRVDGDRDAAAADMLRAARKALPWLAEDAEVGRCHVWRYSQAGQEEKHGAAGGVVECGDGLLFAGDGYGHSSNFEACAVSAARAAEVLCELLAVDWDVMAEEAKARW